MRLSALARVPGGPLSGAGEVPVIQGWGPDPARQFRAVGYLGFSCGTLAEGLSLEAQDAALLGEFLPLDYDALHPPAPLAAAGVEEADGFLIVDLGGVRRVRRVVLARSAVPLGATLEVFRLDGDRPAAEPSVEAASDFVIQQAEEHFLRGPSDPAAGAVRASVHGAAAPGAPGHEAVEHAAHAAQGTVAFRLTGGFEDARFALRITSEGAPGALGGGDLRKVEVTSAPANPRLGLADPSSPPPEEPDRDALADLLLFWPDPTGPPSAPTLQVDAGGGLGKAAQSHVTRRVETLLERDGSPLPGRVDVAVVVAADAPCRFRLGALALDYHLERRSLEPPEEKAVLRFSPDRVEAREVAVLLPRGAQVASAQVEVSLGRASTGGVPAARESALPPVSRGLVVAELRGSAQRLDLTEAVVVAGLIVGLLPLVPDTEVLAEIREDAGGLPAGRLVSGGKVVLGPLGRALWAGIAFGSHALVPSGPLWVCLRASRGRAVWLAETWGPGVDAAELSVGAETLAVLRGARALCALPAAAAPGVSEGGLGLDAAGTAVPGGAGPAEGRVTFDAAAALTAAAGQAGNGPVAVALRFTAAPGTLLTVYPPRVVYDL